MHMQNSIDTFTYDMHGINLLTRKPPASILTLASELLAINVRCDAEEWLALTGGLGDIVLQARLHLVQHHHRVHGCCTFWDLLGRIGNFHWFSRLEWKV